MTQLIQPRILKGFRDYPPELMIPRERLLETARRVYRSYGFAPIDTPVLEFTEILLKQGGEETERQLFRFKHHDDDVAMRFDLTVPLARFSAMHVAKLGTPFKRYHMGPVWRGERPQKGRYREFWQCDFDIIGTLSNAADCETALVIHDLMVGLGLEGFAHAEKPANRLERFEIRINNRLLLNGLLEEMGIADKSVALLRTLDKLPKIGPDNVSKEMQEEAKVSLEQTGRVIALAALTGDNADILDRVQRDFGGNAKVAEGVARLRELLAVTAMAGVPSARIRIDLSICRGLDYYTGTIYETFLIGTYTDAESKEEKRLESFGSICSGGRYDNLASLYTKTVLPGVGASLGLDRLLAAMEELGMLPKVATPAPVFIVQFDAARLGDYQRVARLLRAAGIGAEVYPDAKKIGPQLAYAEKKGFAIALIAGTDEFAKGVWKVKHLASRTEVTVPEGDLLAGVNKLLH
ncbi:MAG: histidine--tRNA ligase [Gemmataceae bacterium]